MFPQPFFFFCHIQLHYMGLTLILFGWDMYLGHWCKRVNSVSNSVAIIIPANIQINDQCLFFTPHYRTHNSLFIPENTARLSETFSRAHEVMDAERNVVLGKRSFLDMPFAHSEPLSERIVVKPVQHVLPPGLSQHLLDIYDSPVYRTDLERMQGFFTTLYDNW